MKRKLVPINEIILQGIVDGLFAEYENQIGPFLNYLQDYGVRLKKYNEPGEYRVYIDYAIIGDTKTHDNNYFYLKEGDTMDGMPFKVMECAEHIVRKVKRFNQEH